MKTNHLLKRTVRRLAVSAVAIFAMMTAGNVFAQDSDTLVIRDTYGPGFYFSPSVPLQSPALPSGQMQHGKIVVNVEMTESDDLDGCIDVAAGIWEQCLFERDTIYITLTSGTLGTDDVETSVVYYSIGQTGLSYPAALYKHLYGRNEMDSSDGMITLNSSTSWNYTPTSGAGKNLTYALARSIGHVLGFTSSLRTVNGVIKTSRPRSYSGFDGLVYTSDSVRLTSVPADGAVHDAEYRHIVEQADSFVYVLNNGYKLYAPPSFDTYSSLRYFYDDNSLMSYRGVPGLQLKVDDATAKVLVASGWDLCVLQHIDLGGDDHEPVSAYGTHEFSSDDIPSNATEQKWEIVYPERMDTLVGLNSYQLTPSGNGVTVQLPNAVYGLNTNSYVTGHLMYSAKVDGEVIRGYRWVTFDLRPLIQSVNVSNIVLVSPTTGAVNFDVMVRTLGAQSVSLTLAQQFGKPVTMQSSTDGTVTFHFQNVQATGSGLLTVEASNGYGTSVYESQGSSIPGLHAISCEESETDVYNYYGILKAHLTALEQLNSVSLPDGHYLLRISTPDQTDCVTVKYTKQ